jgi:hypothetical protein
LIDPTSRSILWQDNWPERDFCLDCHASTAPTVTLGISFTAQYSGTGWFKEKYISSTHDLYLSGPDCRACHNSHGSVNASLVISPYNRTDRTAYSANLYSLCWSCHRTSAIISSNNAFGSRHNTHVSGQQSPCIHCHDVHAPYDAGESGLINFTYGVSRMDVVLNTGRTQSTVFTPGSCYLTCHGSGGTNHNPETYTRSPANTSYCANCHNARQGPRRAVTGEFALNTHHISPTLSTNRLTYILDCTACHEFSTHQQNAPQRLPQIGAVGLKAPDSQRVINYTGVGALYDRAVSLDAFCQGCHDDNGGARFANPFKPFSTVGRPISASAHSNINFTANVSYTAQLEQPFKVTCMQCHANHGSSNIKIITTTVVITGNTTTGPVSFLRLTGTNSFDDNTSTAASRICVTCHTNASDPGYPMASHTGGVHPAPIGNRTTQDCTTGRGCHSHNPDGNSSTFDGFMSNP